MWETGNLSFGLFFVVLFVSCCKAAADNTCQEEKDPGPCDGDFSRYYFDSFLRMCRPFSYGGCGGNQNNFATIEECQQRCFHVCNLEKDHGSCNKVFMRSYFDRKTGKCERFDYSGCEGNGNRFRQIEDCQRKCTDVCVLPKKVGPCEAAIPSYFFNAETGSCEFFLYGGCFGNANRFGTLNACRTACQADICKLPKDRGPCNALKIAWHYDDNLKDCQPFLYGGCGGNRNNFKTSAMCRHRCQETPVAGNRCDMPKDVGSGTNSIGRYYYDKKEAKCRYFKYGGSGGNENNFKTLRECQHNCPEKSVCAEPLERGRCNGGQGGSEVQRWYYDIESLTCKYFSYGSCKGNGNNFKTKRECQNKCNGCTEPAVTGVCHGFFKRWNYNPKINRCETFVFGGCGGNFNNYETLEECIQHCG